MPYTHLEPASGINLKVLFRQTKRPRVAVPCLLTFLSHGEPLRLGAPPQFQSSVGQRPGGTADRAAHRDGELGEAYALAVQAERYIPDDPMLAKFWPVISWSDSINTTPSGVSVFRRNYNAPNDHGKWLDVRPS